MAAKKTKPKAKKSPKSSRPRCICGAFCDIHYDFGRRIWREGSCTKCQEKAMDAELQEGGAIRFVDEFEVEWEYFNVTAEWAAIAEYTGRCRLMDIDGERLWVAIFKAPTTAEGVYEWFGQPIPWEE
jgi:hypothetical protein